PIQGHIVPVDCQKPSMPQFVESIAEPPPDVDPELALEILAIDMPALHLQNQLANHALFRRRRQRAVNRKLACLKFVDIGLEFVLVLKMGTAYVGEGRHTQADQVRARPEQVAVEESALRRVFDSGVSAADAVAGLLQL